MTPGSARIGPYRLLRELGRGAMGVVYLAERDGLQGKVALKVLLEVTLDPELLARFRLEAAIASKLKHPGIVAVHDVGHDAGRPYFVMEYCPGESLEARLRQEGRLEPRRAAELVTQLARAIGFAHQQGVLHRDLKPANVILSARTAGPRITDFGLAQDRSLARSLTRTGDVLGTPSYMAPEQLKGRKDVDARVDVYSLGVLLYVCLTGVRPYEAPSIYHLVQVVCAGGCRPPGELTDVPPELERICMRALAMDRGDRYPDGSHLADALEDFLAQGDASAPDPHRSSWARASGVAAVLLAGAVGGWIGWRQAEDPASAPRPSPTPRADAVVIPDAVAVPSPLPPQDPRLAEGIARCERWLLEAFAGRRSATDPIARIADHARSLASDHPRDPSLRILVDFGELGTPRESDPLTLKRRWLSALEEVPRPSDVLAALTARLCYQLGFHRAAADVLRARLAEDPTPLDWAVHSQVELLLLTLPPVADYARAERLERHLIERLDRHPRAPDELDLPNRDTCVAYLMAAQAAQGHAREAVDEWERSGDDNPGIAKLARYIARVPRFDPLTVVSVKLGRGALLEAFTSAEGAEDPRAIPERFRDLADVLLDRGEFAHAALALLRGARMARRLGQQDRTRDLLDAALKLRLPQDPDVAAEVARELGRVVLDTDPARAEELGREATAPGGALELRTPGELADAWLLVARAAGLRGRQEVAGEALERAARFVPVDSRELRRLQGTE